MRGLATLSEKGLKKVGAFYLLPEDAGFPDRLKELRRGETDDGRLDVTRRMLGDGLGIDDRIHKAEKEIVALHEQMEKVKGDPVRYNYYVGEIRKREVAIADAHRWSDQFKERAADLPMQRDWVTPRLELTADLEAAVGRYSELATDPEITAALAAINAETTIRYRLGPSQKLKEELPRLIKSATPSRPIPCG